MACTSRTDPAFESAQLIIHRDVRCNFDKMKTTEDIKIKLSEIEEVPINDFSRLKELIEKRRFEIVVNLLFKRNIKDFKEMFKSADFFVIKLTETFPYLLMILLIICTFSLTNYYLLIGLPLLYILRNSGILDIWISILIFSVVLIVNIVFKIDNQTFYILLLGSILTYLTSKISFKTFINSLKEKSLESENNFCLSFQMNMIKIIDVRQNETYTIENKKST